MNHALKKTTLIDAIVPHAPSTLAKNTALILVGSWVIALSAQISFYTPWSLIPVTLQTFSILLLACTFGKHRGTLAVITYIAQGAAGFPFFAGAKFGLAHLQGPTAGYLSGFILAAYIVGVAAERGKDRSFMALIPYIILAYAVIFTCGVTWLTRFVGFPASIYQGFILFIPGEILKMLAINSLLPFIWTKVKQS